VYSFAPRPTLAFYFDVPLEEAVRRILTGRPELKYYEAGVDLGLSADPYESFRQFQGLIRDEYGRLVDEFGLIRVDATDTLVNQQQRMRSLVQPTLDGVMRADATVVAHALSAYGLVGRYLNGGGGAARRKEITA
jgi:dTMP kinase